MATFDDVSALSLVSCTFTGNSGILGGFVCVILYIMYF